jgi:diaminopimelate decarboxylase
MRADLSLFARRMELFPVSTAVIRIGDDSQLSLAGCSLVDLATRFGTPLYVYDQTTLDNNLAAYRDALVKYYPAPAGITYAGKAFLCLAVAQWIRQRGISLDATGEGEIYLAVEAGLPPSQLVVHGVNKSQADLQAAITHAGTLVVDNLSEMSMITSLYQQAGAKTREHFPEIWLRFRPGTSVNTHAHIQTGQEDSKFGLSHAEFIQAVEMGREAEVQVTGLHFHLGSNMHTLEPFQKAIQVAFELIDHTRLTISWYPQTICVGGGWGVPYHEDDIPHLSIDELVHSVAQAIIKISQSLGTPLPRLQFEPGRSLIAGAGLAIYRVGTKKQTPHRSYLLLDGGMADNPRPALYQARYTALPVKNPERKAKISTWLAGPYCESGDILIQDLKLPEIESGELVAVPVSGAYQLSMASNYNGSCKPAVVWLADGHVHLIQTRQTVSDLWKRDKPLIFE